VVVVVVLEVLVVVVVVVVDGVELGEGVVAADHYLVTYD
jgi:hypothetical protein